MRRAQGHWLLKPLPVLGAIAVFLLHVGLMYRAALRHTGGVVSYPVDDAFIHLALARQIVEHGVYGIAHQEFAPVSSSIGWPLLLVLGIKAVGLRPWLPLAFNALFAIGIVVYADKVLRTLVPDVSAWRRFVFNLLLVVMTPMPTLVVLGMEHSSHTFAMIAFLLSAGLWLGDGASDAAAARRLPIDTMLWAAFLTTWRYEGIFPIALVFVLACVRRRFVPGTAVAASGALPILSFGTYLKIRYGAFLPLPVILKGRHIEIHDPTDVLDLLGGDIMNRLGQEPHVLAIAALTVGAGVVIVRRDGFWTPLGVALAVLFGSLVFHVEFASLGWFYRYESYLVATGLAFGMTAVLRAMPEPGTLRAALRKEPVQVAGVAFFLIVLSAPVFRRASEAGSATPMACRNVFQQQMQSARFLAGYFDREKVAVNDIGAVAWLGNEEIIDLMGLATLPVAKAKGMKLDKAPSPADLERLTAGVDVAIIYDEWFGEGLPSRWLRLGRWRIDTNRSCAFASVSIYGTNPETYTKVIEAMRSFAKTMPEGIWQEGRYADRDLTSEERIRVGDRLLVGFAPAAELTGSFEVRPDGAIYPRRVGPVIVRGKTPDEARAAIARRIEEVGAAEHLTGTQVTELHWVRARTPVIHVAGRVSSAMEIEGATTLEQALAAASTTPSAAIETAWVWRESATGFVKRSQAELGKTGLIDGDIVVVP